MKFIADFHIHSKYSYATSKFMGLNELATWGQLKGISVMGTGDFLHTAWQQELSEKLIETSPGLFQLKPETLNLIDKNIYEKCKATQYFILSCEINTIFYRKNRCYKIHSLLLAPSFEIAKQLSKEFSKYGNLSTDGRPILKCDIKKILTICLTISSNIILIPAHSWTPHFGIFGAKSGFNSLTEAFEELTPYIYSIEKGLSSSLALNARFSELDKLTILCNSDAHSVQKLGREANIFNLTTLSYFEIIKAIKENDTSKIKCGIEFFPERGKYYADGHSACNFFSTPESTIENNYCCLICKKPLTIGVLNRVTKLADRSLIDSEKFIRKSLKIVPLLDIITYCLNTTELSKKAQATYHNLLKNLGPEFYILCKAPLAQISKFSSEQIAQSISNLRENKIKLTPGYDGIYGKIKLI